jgi:hypothetical protein
VVGETGADARQRVHDVDAERAQPLRLADTGELEQMRRADRACAEDHLAARHGGLLGSGDARFDADGAAVLDQHALHLRERCDAQVGPVAHRLQERLGGVHADAAALRHVEIGDAVIVATVEVGHARDAGRNGCIADGVQDRPMQALALDAQFAAGAMGLVGTVDEVLMLPEQRQHIVPAPALVAELAPLVIVARLAAHVDHAVDRGAAAQNLAARIVDGAPAEALLSLGLEAPVSARIPHAIEIADRDVDPEEVILAAGFQQQHRDLRIGGEPIRQQAAGCPTADDDVVVGAER